MIEHLSEKLLDFGFSGILVALLAIFLLYKWFPLHQQVTLERLEEAKAQNNISNEGLRSFYVYLEQTRLESNLTQQYLITILSLLQIVIAHLGFDQEEHQEELKKLVDLYNSQFENSKKYFDHLQEMIRSFQATQTTKTNEDQ